MGIMGATLALATGTCLLPAQATDQVTPATVSATSISSLVNSTQPTERNPFLVGAGVSDITGEVAEVGFIGYGTEAQKGSGLHTRQYARAFVVIDPATGSRNLIVVLDAMSGWESIRAEIVSKVRADFGSDFNESNIMITATHTHATTGGVSKDVLYNITTMGFHSATFNAQVNGSMQAIREALADLAPGNVTVSTSQVTGVGVNRSAVAQFYNPKNLMGALDRGVDPTNTTFRFE